MTPTDPEIQTAQPEAPPAEPVAQILSAPESSHLDIAPKEQDPVETRFIRWVFLGSQGLRACWSVLSFILVFAIFASGVGFAFSHLHLVNKRTDFSPSSAFFGELISFLAVVGAAAVLALIEQRRGNLLAYNLQGPRRLFHFFSGLVAGIAALSVLIGGLALGGWLHLGPIALSGAQIIEFGALWAAAFLLVGFVEEGIFRCYLQFTLTRGINFWWALGIVALVCGELLWRGKGSGIWGVYIIAGLGLIPCALLHVNKTPGSSFWQATWVTSTLFGFVHTGNNGENWIGIFAAAGIGFVFCVSIWATGSAWWAIGCHAAWDWSETYFYGAADSGNVAIGHYLSTTPAGPVLWSGGTDGPEGSVLVLGVILLLLVALTVLHRRSRPAAFALPATEQLAS